MGDDDDDSIADDDWSLDSEESFYVGIERVDYAQPDALALYGEVVGDDAAAAKEDRFGVGRASAALASSMEEGRRAASDWDADVPVSATRRAARRAARVHARVQWDGDEGAPLDGGGRPCDDSNDKADRRGGRPAVRRSGIRANPVRRLQRQGCATIQAVPVRRI